MKPISFLLYALLFAAQVHAQLASRLVQRIDSAQMDNPYYLWQITDYKYSGGRGKELFNPTTQQFDTRYDTCFTVSQGLAMFYTGQARLYNSLDLPVSHRRVVSFNGIFNWGNQLDSFVYNTDGTLKTFFKGAYINGVFSAPDQAHYVYDAKGNLLLRDAWNEYEEYSYDNYSNLHNIKTIDKSFFDTTKRTYTYIHPAFPKLSMLIEEKTERWDNNSYNAELKTYEYNNSRQLIKATTWEYNTSGKFDKLFGVDSNIYTGAGDLVLAYRKYANGSIYSDSNAYDGNHNMIFKERRVLSGGYLDRSYTTTTYNKYNQPLEQRNYDFHDGSQTWLKSNSIYYSLFTYDEFTPTEVEQFNNSLIGELAIHPNPASQVLGLTISTQQLQAARLAIYDINGRLLRQWNEDLTGTTERTIPVGDLANGNYILQLTTPDGKTAKQFTIQR